MQFGGIWLYAIIISAFSALCVAAFLLVFIKAGYYMKMLVKLGLAEQTATPNHAVLAWENCLRKLNFDFDVAFLGDSITLGCDFSKAFPQVKIVNLGFGGDSLAGMVDRVSMVQAVKPEKVFVMGGINGLTDYNKDQCIQKYNELVSDLCEALPETEIYIQSVLPISRAKERALLCHNTTIEKFNTALKTISQENGLVYVDLYSLYINDGAIDPPATADGIHLTQEGYRRWEEAVSGYMTQ